MIHDPYVLYCLLAFDSLPPSRSPTSLLIQCSSALAISCMCFYCSTEFQSVPDLVAVADTRIILMFFPRSPPVYLAQQLPCRVSSSNTLASRSTIGPHSHSSLLLHVRTQSAVKQLAAQPLDHTATCSYYVRTRTHISVCA